MDGETLLQSRKFLGELAIYTWQQIHVTSPMTNWSKVVWFSHEVPRYAFITWLAVKNRLSTGDRMQSWGQIQGCLFCGEPNETRDYLFFCLSLYV